MNPFLRRLGLAFEELPGVRERITSYLYDELLSQPYPDTTQQQWEHYHYTVSKIKDRYISELETLHFQYGLGGVTDYLKEIVRADSEKKALLELIDDIHERLTEFLLGMLSEISIDNMQVKLKDINEHTVVPTTLNVQGKEYKLKDANLKFGSGKMSKALEEKLRVIVDRGTPKTVTVKGNKYHISKGKIDFIRNEEEKHGGILPLIPLIIGAIGAAGAAAGGAAGIAKAVNDKKANDKALEEERRHNMELEKAARGSGVGEVIKDFARRSGLEEGGKRLLKNTLYNLSDSIKIEKKGSGLYLQPWGS